MDNQQKNFFDNFPSKTSFYMGIAAAVFGICTIGFFVLGSMALNGGIELTKGPSGSPSADIAVNNPSPSAVPTAAAPAANVPAVDEDDHIRGDVNAPITLIEYSDFECPFCKRFHPTVLQIMDEYEGKVRWVYRHFPLSFHDPLATSEAVAAECAGDVGGNDDFWEMTDMIYAQTNSNGNGLLLSQLSDFAEDIGLNRSAFDTCMNSGKFDEKIKNDVAEGSAAGVTGTPGSFLVDSEGRAQAIKGALPFSSIQPIIESMLK